MTSDGSITRWIAGLETSQADEAREKLWERYFHRLIGLARLKLGQTPRSAADEEDVAIEALQSFFTGAARGQYPSLRDRDDLWPLLAKITAHKALDQQRHMLAEKRGGGHVLGESAIAGPSGSFADWPAALLDQEFGPDHLAAMNEECDRLMALLTDDQLRQIATRRLQGYSNSEIANELGVVERTVERRLQLIRALWNDSLRAD